MIKVLDKKTIDKIAAGEIIERPSSVVKELVENSVDSLATAITIEIRDGGLSFIRVTDNGCGIAKDEIRLAYTSHATSKLHNVDDLLNISSLGFRGEALATIAAVSQTEMITKEHSSLTGAKYTIHGGEEIEFKEVGAPDGTTIVTRNLFFNTPARKKFLKSSTTEGNYINDLILRIALSRPDISFKLINNNKPILDTTGNGKVQDIIYQFYGRDITSNIMPIQYKMNDIMITGFVGKPNISRGNRSLENYFINGRYIKSNIINRAIEEAYKTFVMQQKFPFTVLYFDLDKAKCDVNVHPTKMEFRYNDEAVLFDAIVKSIRATLTKKELIPETILSKNTNNIVKNEKSINKENANIQPFEHNRNTFNNRSKVSQTYKILEALKNNNPSNTESKDDNVSLELKGQALNNNIIYNKVGKNNTNIYEGLEEDKPLFVPNVSKDEAVQTTLFDNKFLSEKARLSHKLIGQLFDTYWLIEYDNNLFIMDQHAAHEKINYEKLISSLKSKEVFSQKIFPPEIISFSYKDRQTVFDNYDYFMRIGFEIEEFGGNEFKINSIPTNLFGISPRALLLEFVSVLGENFNVITEDIFIKKLSTVACKKSIKGNTRISFEEANSLIEQLLELENPYTCPHGRPTIISMNKVELEKKFKRIL